MVTQVLGATKPNKYGELLGTGYREFESPSGINGLYKQKDGRLDLLAVMATQPSTGQFRSFIRACKNTFSEIYVWEIMNPELNAILTRYGFKPAIEQQDGEQLNGWKWLGL